MKHSVRFFAIGLFTASVLTLGFYLFVGPTDATNEELSTEELIAQIEEAGYRVITDEEFISYSLYVDEKNEQAKSEEVKDKDKKDNKNKKDSKKNDNEKGKDKAKDKDKDKDKDKNKKKKDKDKDKKKKKKDKDEVKKLKFTIKAGDVPSDIAEVLVENNIIKDRQKFIDYIEDNDYSSKIQLGKFEVTSEMSLKEIAKTITTYPGN